MLLFFIFSELRLVIVCFCVMLSRFRNAYLAKKTVVVLKATRTVKDIAQVLAQEGFLGPIENEANGFFTVTLKRGVKQFERVSTPGVRLYVNHKELPPVLNGMGVAVISTSKGVITDKEARDLNIGGEIICHIY